MERLMPVFTLRILLRAFGLPKPRCFPHILCFKSHRQATSFCSFGIRLTLRAGPRACATCYEGQVVMCKKRMQKKHTPQDGPAFWRDSRSASSCAPTASQSLGVFRTSCASNPCALAAHGALRISLLLTLLVVRRQSSRFFPRAAAVLGTS